MKLPEHEQKLKQPYKRHVAESLPVYKGSAAGITQTAERTIARQTMKSLRIINRVARGALLFVTEWLAANSRLDALAPQPFFAWPPRRSRPGLA